MELITKVALDTVFVGTKKINFLILKMLPTDTTEIMKELGLSKVTANNHINELEKYDLLERKRYTGKIYPTKLTKSILRIVKKIREAKEIQIKESDDDNKINIYKNLSKNKLSKSKKN